MRNDFFLVVDPGSMPLPEETLARSREKKDVFSFVFLVVDPGFDAPGGLMPGADRPLRPLGTPLLRGNDRDSCLRWSEHLQTYGGGA